MISSVVELEACIGAPGLTVLMKVIDHLDVHAARWIAASPFAAVVDDSAAIRRARLWDSERMASLPTINAIATVVAHVKANQTRGLTATTVRMLVNEKGTGLALAADYKRNLY